jgi:hypothetical protein
MLDIDAAIKHCLEVAEQNETQADKWQEEGGEQWGKTIACRECAKEHRQLAEWLKELKDLREENKVLMQECDRLIKEKGELLSKVSGGDVLRICQLEEQLEKAKRLLKSSTNVLNKFIPCDEDYCSECIKQRQNCDYDDSFKWRYADEALALIGEDGDTE